MLTRYLVTLATFLLSMLLYVDRVCISSAKDPIAADLHLTDDQMGWIFGAFSLGYALFQAPAGMLADRFGARRVLAAVVCCWSLFTALTAAVARQLGTMLLMRFLFGVGEAGAFPGMSRAIYSWQPMSERGLAHGINFSASRLGAAFAMPGVAWLISQVGWRPSFVILGAVGIVWAAVWYAWFRDDPAEHTGISPAEREFILQNRQQRDPTATTPRLSIGTIARSGNMWLLMAQYFASNFTVFFCLTWLLPYLKVRYELSATTAGWYAMFPLLGGMVGNWLSGGLIDAIFRRGHWALSRRAPAMIGFVLAAVGLTMSLAMEGPASTVFCITLAILGVDMTPSASWSVCVDVGRRHAGAVSGTMNMAGNIGAFVTALAFPYMQKWTGSTAPFFLAGAALDLLAVALWIFIRADRPLGDE